MSYIDNKKEYFVKAGTYFFRRALITGYESCMFFGFNVAATSSSDRAPNEKVQIWQTINDFSVLYAVSKYQNEHRSNEYRISSLPDIYIKKYPNIPKVDFLDIKRDTIERKKLLEILIKENVFGWVTSVENTVVMELFLFGDNISKLIEFKGYAKETDDKIHDYQYFTKSNIIRK